jgi:protease I
MQKQRRGKGIPTDGVVETGAERQMAVEREERHPESYRSAGETVIGIEPRARSRARRSWRTAQFMTLEQRLSEEAYMQEGLNGRKVAILATHGVEQVELVVPRRALDAAGALTHLIAPTEGSIQAMNHDEKGARIPVDRVLGEVHASEYDALLLPGGVANPDNLRMNEHAVQFVREFMLSEKPVAAICHGPWMLVEATAVAGRTLTSWPSLKTDIRNAGGQWVDEEVQVDDQLVTSRKPADLPKFCATIVREFAAGIEDARVDDVVEQSFPASDPPPGPTAIGGQGAARS